MAELAAGAVSSLLGVLKNEAQLLRRVGKDVVFIKEEMESMNSFLEHLARTAPPRGSHDEQVQTWMKQVRDLAHDCSNCIDHYLRHGDPAIYRARSGPRGYLWWAFWIVEEFVAQHKAAVQLRELKERASDVGKRRLRYGVENPGAVAGGRGSPGPAAPAPSSSSSQAVVVAVQDEEDDEDEDEVVGGRRHRARAAIMAVADSSSSSYNLHQALEPPSLDDHFLEKIGNWVAEARKAREPMPCIAIAETSDADHIVSEGLARAQAQFKHMVRIKLSRVHYQNDKLGPNRVLCYILRESQLQKEDSRPKDQRFEAWRYKWKVKREILKQIKADVVDSKIEKLQHKIEDIERWIDKRRGGGGVKDQAPREETEENKVAEETRGITNTNTSAEIGTEGSKTNKTEDTGGGRNMAEEKGGDNKSEAEDEISLVLNKPIDVLYQALLTEDDKKKNNNNAKDVLGEDDQIIIKKTAEKLKSHMEICLDDTQYQGILKELFLTTSNHRQEEAQETTTTATTSGGRAATLGDDQMKEIMGQIKEIIRIVKEDIMEEMQYTKSHPPREKILGHDQIVRTIQVAKKKMEEISLKIKEQMVIKGIVDRIDAILGVQDTLIILEDENRRRGPKWEDIINALKLFKCARGSAVIVTTTRSSDKAKEFCWPPRDPFAYSLVGLYHDTVLKLRRQQGVDNEEEKNTSQIIRDILDKCHPQEFCMKMFARALYANPNRSKKDLVRLCDDLQVSEDSQATNARKMFKFSYRDLPREHKTCLLYLAVFPPGEQIRRSIIIGRWITEGLITKEDWPTAVRHAKQCYNALIDRMLVSPGAFSDKGEYKSCMVSALVHGFVTKIAKKQHILDARLSHALARHFSIFSGLRLRASDTLDMFVKNLHSYSAQLSLLKLLDLQGCRCFDKKNHYLKAICNNIPLLKYLSLRDTNVTNLPKEINHLHDLEILDIRQTQVPGNATRNVLLLKLRRLLAGGTDPTPSSIDIVPKNSKDKSLHSSVHIPRKIEKMENMEVLTRVMASLDGHELKDIGNLLQLRKLGVVIKDNKKHILNFLQAFDDLKECLQSLSITIPKSATRVPDYSNNEKILQDKLYNSLTEQPKVLESLSINGDTRIGLLSLLGKASNELAKIALIGTKFKEDRFLKVFATHPKLCCVRLGHDAYIHVTLDFNNDEFKHLKCLHVEGHNMTEMKFHDGAAVELEKIVLSSTMLKSLPGVGRLPTLKELVLRGNELLFVPSEDGGDPQQNTVPVSPSGDGAPQQTKPPASTSEGGGDPQKNTVLVSPSGDGAPQQTKLPASTSEGGGDPQQNTVLVSPSEVGAAPEKSSEQLVSPSEDGAAPGKGKEHVSPIQDGEAQAPQKKPERKITFKKEEFQHLKYFNFENSKMISIIFEDGAAPKLEKIILSLSSKQSQLTVFGRLPRLKEIELTCDKSILHSLFDIPNQIEKVTLSDTLLKQSDLVLLAKKAYINCLVLLENSYDDSQLIFNEDEFKKLNLLSVNCSKITHISFTNGSAPNLEKIFWSFTKLESLLGIDNVQKLKEIELNGDSVPPQVRRNIRAHKKKPVLVTSKNPQHQDVKNKKDQGEASWFGCVSTSCFTMKKDHHFIR